MDRPPPPAVAENGTAVSGTRREQSCARLVRWSGAAPGPAAEAAPALVPVSMNGAHAAQTCSYEAGSVRDR